MGKVRGQTEEMVGAQHRPVAPDVVTAGAPLREGDGGSVLSVRERLRSRDLAVNVFVAGATYVALVWISKAWAVVGAVLSPIVSDLVRDFVERHRWSLRRLRRGSAATVLLGHEEAAYASRKRAGRRGPGGRIPGGLMASVAAVALVTAAIAAAKVHDRVIPNHHPQQPHQHRPVAGRPNRVVELHGATPTADPPSLHWRPVPGAGRYLVYERRKVVGTRTAAHFTDTNATWGPHTYRVAAESNGRVGHRSHPYTIVYQKTPPPSSPIVVSGPTPTTQPPLVTWTTVSRADEYAVYRDGRRIDTRSATETRYTDRGVGAGTYTYQVAWMNAGVESRLSRPHTIDYRPVVVTPPLRLTRPTGLSGTTPTTEPPSLTWDLVDGATGYDIYGDGKLVGSQPAPPFNDMNASIGRHVYVVIARTGATTSDNSAPYTIDYVVLPAPTGVHPTSTITELPAFAWDAVPGADGYVVYRNGVALPEVHDPAYQEPDVSNPPVSYTYFVRAVNHVGVQGAASESVTIAYNPYSVVN